MADAFDKEGDVPMPDRNSVEPKSTSPLAPATSNKENMDPSPPQQPEPTLPNPKEQEQEQQEPQDTEQKSPDNISSPPPLKTQESDDPEWKDEEFDDDDGEGWGDDDDDDPFADPFSIDIMKGKGPPKAKGNFLSLSFTASPFFEGPLFC